MSLLINHLTIHCISILTASYLGVYSPIPYAKVHTGIMNNGSVGINFAFGGSGVFQTASFCPNVSTQIDQLQGVINNGLVSQELINASIALVLINGNDYSKYIATNGTAEVLHFSQCFYG